MRHRESERVVGEIGEGVVLPEIFSIVASSIYDFQRFVASKFSHRRDDLFQLLRFSLEWSSSELAWYFELGLQ